MENRKTYMKPAMEVNKFSAKDIILTSGNYSSNATQEAFVELEKTNANLRRFEDEAR